MLYLILFNNAKPDVKAILATEAFIVSTDIAKNPGAKHGAGAVGRLVELELFGLILSSSNLCDDLSGFVGFVVVGEDEGNGRVSIKALKKPFEGNGHYKIVGIEAHKKFPPGQPEGHIAGGDQPFVLLADDGDAVRVFIPREDLFGVVGGAVVDEDEFKVAAGLVENALNGLIEIFAVVVVGYVNS